MQFDPGKYGTLAGDKSGIIKLSHSPSDKHNNQKTN